MRDVDHVIEQALSAEERDILRRMGDGPGYFKQVGGLFTGPVGWVNAVLMGVQAMLFAGGVWLSWLFFGATDALTAIQLGLPAAVLLLASLIIKLSMGPALHTNRLMRELKRLELQIASMRQQV